MVVLCDECGTPFVREPWHQGRPQRFCSKQCRNRVAARNYRARQSERLRQAEEAARQPATTDAETADALNDAYTAVDRLADLRSRVRYPQRMDEAHQQVEDVRATIDQTIETLVQALQRVARCPNGERHP